LRLWALAPFTSIKSKALFIFIAKWQGTILTLI
jgi:hypothetical protein